MIVLDTRSPERAWPPLLDWLREQGLDPSTVRSIAVDPVALTASVDEYCLRDGHMYSADGRTMATRTRLVSVASLPPRRL